MKHLAKAVVDALAFLELSSDDVIDPDSAVKAMEMIAATLHEASDDEVEALAQAAMAELNAQAANDAPEEVIDFYENFLVDFGLEEEVEEEEEGEDKEEPSF
jgi:hypothetical protein